MHELALPQSSKLGWPWAEANTDMCGLGSNLPRITIITPSFNQAAFIEETMRSVLQQNYGNLQYIVMDGGSSDGSSDIIQKYAPFLDYWVSEKDAGQSNAINSGAARATGDLIAWLNSDDVLLPGALHAVAKAYLDKPGSMIVGGVQISTDDEKVNIEMRPGPLNLPQLLHYWSHETRWSQPGFFFPSKVWRDLGGVDESLQFAMDLDFLCRICPKAPPLIVDKILARFRLHEDCKSVDADIFSISENKLTTKQQVYSFLRSRAEIDMVVDRYAEAAHFAHFKEHKEIFARQHALVAGRLLRQGKVGLAMDVLHHAGSRGMLPSTIASLIQQTMQWVSNRGAKEIEG